MADQSVRTKMASAAKRIVRLKRIDRAAVFIITMGGLAVVVGVLGILVFIAAEALPMFRGATLTPKETVRAAGDLAANDPSLRAVGVDEYRRYLFTIERDARIVFYDASTGKPAHDFAMPGLSPGTRVVSSSRSHLGNFLAAGTSDGRVALAQVMFTPKYENEKFSGLDIAVRERGLVSLDVKKRPVREVSYYEDDGRRYVAAIVDEAEIAIWRTDDAGTEHRTSVTAAGAKVSHVRVGRHGAVVASTPTGQLYRWVFDDGEPKLTDVSKVADEPVTALEFLIGGNSVVVGTAGGQVTSWFPASMPDGAEAMIRGHTYESQGSAVVAFAPSPRERSFAAAGADGSIVLRHQTSETTWRVSRVSPRPRLW